MQNKTDWRARSIKIIGILVVASLLILGGMRLYRKPLGPALALPTATLARTVTPGSTGTSQPDAPTLAPSQTAAPTAQPVCGGPATMTILAVGSDSRGNHYLYGLADVVRIIRADFVTPRVTILEIPRDLWVEIPGISEHYGITHGKVNQAYLYGNPGLGYYDEPAQGPGLLARTLDVNFGIRPDHYLAVNMQTFVNFVDYLGGVDVYLPYRVDASTPDNPKAFAVDAGQHHFDGQTALMVARIRQYNVFGRAENQNIIMCALRKKLLSPAVVSYIPEIAGDFQRYVQTDFSLEQINQLACLANEVSGKDVVFVSFPTELFKKSSIYDPSLKTNVFIFDTDFNVLRGYIDQFNQGTWPDPDEIIINTPAPDEPDSSFTCD